MKQVKISSIYLYQQTYFGLTLAVRTAQEIDSSSDRTQLPTEAIRRH